MKKWYSKFMMLTIMLAVSNFAACGNDDDGGSGEHIGGMTLVVDGEKYYAPNCHAEQTHGNGMYLIVNAATNAELVTSGHELTVHISPNIVANLKEGQVFDDNSMRIQYFRRISESSLNTYQWEVVSGNITINKITKMEMTIQFNSLQLEHKQTGVMHTISGIAVLNSGVYSSNGTLLSFEDAIK